MKKKRVKKDLFELVQDAIGLLEVPVEEQLINDGQVLAGLGEPGEELLHVALGLLLDEPAEP